MAAAKFKIGDKVKVNGRDAEVIVVSRDLSGPIYGVKFKSWVPKTAKNHAGNEVTTYLCPEGSGAERDHEYDSQGAIHEDDLEAVVEKKVYHGRNAAGE